MSTLRIRRVAPHDDNGNDPSGKVVRNEMRRSQRLQSLQPTGMSTLCVTQHMIPLLKSPCYLYISNVFKGVSNDQ